MWLLSLLPDAFMVWIVHLITLAGLLALGVSFFLTKVPLVGQYGRMLKIAGALALVLGIYLEGGVATEQRWRDRVTELEAKVKEAAMATISGLSAKYEALLAKVSGIESNSKTVEEKVAKTVANLGVEPIAADMQSENIVKEKSATEIVSEFESINDAKEKRAFYKKHAQTIIDATFPKKR